MASGFGLLAFPGPCATTPGPPSPRAWTRAPLPGKPVAHNFGIYGLLGLGGGY